MASKTLLASSAADTTSKGDGSPASVPASPAAPVTSKMSSAPSSPSATSSTAFNLTFASRFDNVTSKTKGLYTKGDFIPPATKSQILRAQKFSVLYFFGVNLLFGVYAFFIPLHQSPPYYGGMNIMDFDASLGHFIVLGLVLTLLFIRFMVMGYSNEYYQFAFLLLAMEGACIVFTVVWWNPGLPVLTNFFVANLVNIACTQVYWKRRFVTTVADIPSLVPTPPPVFQDSTGLTLSFSNLGAEFMKLWGFDVPKTEAMRYDERCGVFGSKDQMSHTQALQIAYTQAVDPAQQFGLWPADDPHIMSLNPSTIFLGLLKTFIANGTFAFGGFWLGKVAFDSWSEAAFGLSASLLIALMYFVSLFLIRSWLHNSLGAAVAEKEWLAFDVVRHGADREELISDVLGSIASSSEHRGLISGNDLSSGRENLVYTWICAAAVADFIGESLLSRIFQNVSVQSRMMLEAMTSREFRLWAHAKWEITWLGRIVEALSPLLLALTSVFYFGSSYEDPSTMPRKFMAFIGLACFAESTVVLVRTAHLGTGILGEKTTHRHALVSEWVVSISVIFVMTNIVIWLYLLPILASWDLPLLGCASPMNKSLFPSACPAVNP
mmetsp:Transcript_13488/g.29492  ORF Transcript_13488/g.29492 Transcript_13488/m.29492 type:complete len:607 (-) Transcript_13488:235-2055(-)